MVFLLILILLLLLSISIIYFSLYYGISPMPSSKKAKMRMLAKMPITASGKVLELGAGWGTLAFGLAKKYPQSQIEAYEISIVPYLFCVLMQKCLRYKNLKLHRKDFFSVSFNECDGVVCYLYPGAMQRLQSKFKEELKPGAFILSNTFALHGWKPTSTFEVDDFYQTKIYLYVM